MSENTVRILAVLVSLVSAAISLLAAYRSRITARQARELQVFGLLRQYHADLRSWGGDSVIVLSRVAYLCELDPARMADNEFFKTRHDLRSQLSALIDRG